MPSKSPLKDFIYALARRHPLYRMGHAEGREAGKAEGWLERDAQIKAKEAARHAKNGQFQKPQINPPPQNPVIAARKVLS